jgi:hypothetical protein
MFWLAHTSLSDVHESVLAAGPVSEFRREAGSSARQELEDGK